jgi:DDE superfamily endonuclease
MLDYLYSIDYRPRNHKELFNLRHARLRNAIERIFGILKKRFKVLLLAQEYSFATQAQIVPAVAALHNFILAHNPNEELTTEDETEPNVDNEDDDQGIHQAAVPYNERTRAGERRDRMAMEMWEDYIERQAHNRR